MNKSDALGFAMLLALLLTGCAHERGLQVVGQSDLPATALKLEELAQVDLEALDRDKTVFFLTFGNIEQHGPHLPVVDSVEEARSVRSSSSSAEVTTLVLGADGQPSGKVRIRKVRGANAERHGTFESEDGCAWSCRRYSRCSPWKGLEEA